LAAAIAAYRITALRFAAIVAAAVAEVASRLTLIIYIDVQQMSRPRDTEQTEILLIRDA
jgi:hypothetical protein